MGHFTVQEGIKVQRMHLEEWKQILKPKVYKDLEKWTTKDNDSAETGFDVLRGKDLDHYISNYQHYKEFEQKQQQP